MAKIKPKFFAPTSFEVPRSLKAETHVFGMGKRNALRLAEQLNKSAEEHPLIVYGCAGSLTSEFRAGDSFVISELRLAGKSEPLPQAHTNLRAASLTTVEKLAANPHVKQSLARATGASLVDMEMAHIWAACNVQVRNRLCLIRSVIDHHDDNIEFLIRKSLWLKPATYASAFQFFKNFRLYLRGVEEFLSHVR